MLRLLKQNRKRLISLVALISFSTCASVSFFSVGLFQNERLLSARATWEAKGIDSYRMVVDVGLPMQIVTRYSIIINDGEITEASSRLGSLGHPNPFKPVQPQEVVDYTIDALFERAATALASVPPIHIAGCGPYFYQVNFDSDLGYLNEFSATCGGGLLGCAIADCGFSFRVVDFEMLSDS